MTREGGGSVSGSTPGAGSRNVASLLPASGTESPATSAECICCPICGGAALQTSRPAAGPPGNDVTLGGPSGRTLVDACGVVGGATRDMAGDVGKD